MGRQALAQETLAALRWTEDRIVLNHFGEVVWLKPCYNTQGTRIGITDCCPAASPCPRHEALAAVRPAGDKA